MIVRQLRQLERNFGCFTQNAESQVREYPARPRRVLFGTFCCAWAQNVSLSSGPGAPTLCTPFSPLVTKPLFNGYIYIYIYICNYIHTGFGEKGMNTSMPFGLIFPQGCVNVECTNTPRLAHGLRHSLDSRWDWFPRNVSNGQVLLDGSKCLSLFGQSGRDIGRLCRLSTNKATSNSLIFPCRITLA